MCSTHQKRSLDAPRGCISTLPTNMQENRNYADNGGYVYMATCSPRFVFELIYTFLFYTLASKATFRTEKEGLVNDY